MCKDSFRMTNKESCPCCGALPCDWVEDPHTCKSEKVDMGKVVIKSIARAAEAIAWQAGVGGMEMAGSIVSYLDRHPDLIEDFLSGKTSIIDWPFGWHAHGNLTWHGMDGKIHHPEEARRHSIIKKMEKGLRA